MIDGIIFLCVISTGMSERCLDLPAPAPFPTVQACNETAENAKVRMRQIAASRGETVTSLSHECKAIPGEET